MSDKPDKFIDDNGLRLDGRRVDEIRPMKIDIGVLSRADGSCYLEWGKNKVLAAVYGPRTLHPRRKQIPDAALIRYRYNMASFSVEDRIRPGPSRRSVEISKVSAEAFEPVVLTKFYPNTVIDIFTEIIQADAGTRTAAINAASIALADAGIPMKGLVSACAVGKVDGQLVLDLNKDEDNFGAADLPVAMTQDGEITLIQMDGNLTQEEFKEAIEMVRAGCMEILEIQKKALYTKFGDDSSFDLTEEDLSDIQADEQLIDEDADNPANEDDEGIDEPEDIDPDEKKINEEEELDGESDEQ
ncbi:exosome complex exonuclease 1 [Methanosalsum zhilinae DSM 4017]|uniref:Exosome complex component Rrp41 n=1 Tax=Methanosalsum zhilinae (strain DSM 4017 / NBRC 107636 / OCM 62 / WeN5) TaxID=679901 RepID=F7XML0_METZD|nr:exosome complex exonuclease Rrp41 [Methanosalsum zhilinae]AEH61025.1 exosome complex exonuclease 1 [Methanosalsum zhilinae DSM 4017]